MTLGRFLLREFKSNTGSLYIIYLFRYLYKANQAVLWLGHRIYFWPPSAWSVWLFATHNNPMNEKYNNNNVFHNIFLISCLLYTMFKNMFLYLENVSKHTLIILISSSVFATAGLIGNPLFHFLKSSFNTIIMVYLSYTLVVQISSRKGSCGL